jgi:hypothetical protein
MAVIYGVGFGASLGVLEEFSPYLADRKQQR